MNQNSFFKANLPIIQHTAQQLLRRKADSKFSWNYLDSTKIEQAHIDVVMNKQFLFNQEKDLWIHFKNISIPTITVRQRLPGMLGASTTMEKQEPVNQASRAVLAQIFAVYEKQDQSSLNFEMLKGQSDVYFEDGLAEFRGLHFSSTSFSQKGQKFLLVIVVQYKTSEEPLTSTFENCQSSDSLKQQQNTFHSGSANTPHIIISQPIYVESRKKAHLERQNKESVFDPFLPELLDRVYFTKNDQSLIEEDVQGLYSYCTQQRIRNKTYHPLFLAMKFNKDIKLYFDSDRLQQPSHNGSDEQRRKFFYKIQHEIMVINKNQDSEADASMPLLMIHINMNKHSSQFQQQLLRVLRTIEGPVAKVVKEAKHIPGNYKELIYSQELREDYRSSYYQLVFLKYQYNSAPEFMNFYEQANVDVNYFSQQNSNNSSAQFHHAEMILSNLTEEQRKKRVKVCVQQNSNNNVNNRVCMTSSGVLNNNNTTSECIIGELNDSCLKPLQLKTGDPWMDNQVQNFQTSLENSCLLDDKQQIPPSSGCNSATYMPGEGGCCSEKKFFESEDKYCVSTHNLESYYQQQQPMQVWPVYCNPYMLNQRSQPQMYPQFQSHQQPQYGAGSMGMIPISNCLPVFGQPYMVCYYPNPHQQQASTNFPTKISQQ